jgi:hypothetical protein
VVSWFIDALYCQLYPIYSFFSYFSFSIICLFFYLLGLTAALSAVYLILR